MLQAIAKRASRVNRLKSRLIALNDTFVKVKVLTFKRNRTYAISVVGCGSRLAFGELCQKKRANLTLEAVFTPFRSKICLAFDKI